MIGHKIGKSRESIFLIHSTRVKSITSILNLTQKHQKHKSIIYLSPDSIKLVLVNVTYLTWSTTTFVTTSINLPPLLHFLPSFLLSFFLSSIRFITRPLTLLFLHNPSSCLRIPIISILLSLLQGSSYLYVLISKHSLSMARGKRKNSPNQTSNDEMTPRAKPRPRKKQAVTKTNSAAVKAL